MVRKEERRKGGKNYATSSSLPFFLSSFLPLFLSSFLPLFLSSSLPFCCRYRSNRDAPIISRGRQMSSGLFEDINVWSNREFSYIIS